MKTINFASNLVPLVLSGKKTSTWRLFDDKALVEGDEIQLREFGKESIFSNAKITRVVEKPFNELTIKDKEGNETFKNDEEMYKTFSGYYHTEVGPETNLKIIWFELEK